MSLQVKCDAGLQQEVKKLVSHDCLWKSPCSTLEWRTACSMVFFYPCDSPDGWRPVKQPSAWDVEGQSRNLRGWGCCPGSHWQYWCQVCSSLIWSESGEVYFGLWGLKQQKPLPSVQAEFEAAKPLCWDGVPALSGGICTDSERHCSAPGKQQHLEEDNEEGLRRCKTFLILMWLKRGLIPDCSMK